MITSAGAAEPGEQGGQLLLDFYVLSHASSFLTLFSACPANFKLLSPPLTNHWALSRQKSVLIDNLSLYQLNALILM